VSTLVFHHVLCRDRVTGQAAGSGSRIEKQVVLKLMLRVFLIFFKSRLWGVVNRIQRYVDPDHPIFELFFLQCVWAIIVQSLGSEGQESQQGGRARCAGRGGAERKGRLRARPRQARRPSQRPCSSRHHQHTTNTPPTHVTNTPPTRHQHTPCCSGRYLFGPLQGLGNAIVYGLNKTVRDEYTRVCGPHHPRKSTMTDNDDMQVR
jgi:hypothetical protein